MPPKSHSIFFLHQLILIVSLLVVSTGCNKVGHSSAQQDAAPQNQSISSPTEGTSLYRYLSALDDIYPDKQSLTQLCISKHGFNLELPRKGVVSAHDIRLPASEEWTETHQVQSQKYKTVMVRPPSVNGIIMESREDQVPYTVTESQEVKRIISGTCIGTEYILK